MQRISLNERSVLSEAGSPLPCPLIPTPSREESTTDSSMDRHPDALQEAEESCFTSCINALKNFCNWICSLFGCGKKEPTQEEVETEEPESSSLGQTSLENEQLKMLKDPATEWEKGMRLMVETGTSFAINEMIRTDETLQRDPDKIAKLRQDMVIINNLGMQAGQIRFAIAALLPQRPLPNESEAMLWFYNLNTVFQYLELINSKVPSSPCPESMAAAVAKVKPLQKTNEELLSRFLKKLNPSQKSQAIEGIKKLTNVGPSPLDLLADRAKQTDLLKFVNQIRDKNGLTHIALPAANPFSDAFSSNEALLLLSNEELLSKFIKKPQSVSDSGSDNSFAAFDDSSSIT